MKLWIFVAVGFYDDKLKELEITISMLDVSKTKYGMEGRALIFGELEIDRCQALVNIMSTCPNCLASWLLMLNSFIVDMLLEKYRISINDFASESLDVSSMSSFVTRKYLESWSPRSQNLDILGPSYINPISPTKMKRFDHVSK